MNRRRKAKMVSDDMADPISAIASFILFCEVSQDQKIQKRMDVQFYRERLMTKVADGISKAAYDCAINGMADEAKFINLNMKNSLSVIVNDLFSRGYSQQNQMFLIDILEEDSKALDGAISILKDNLSKLK
jgi:hypothetical protein